MFLCKIMMIEIHQKTDLYEDLYRVLKRLKLDLVTCYKT